MKVRQEFDTTDEQWDRFWQEVNTKSWDEEVATQQFTDWSEARQLKKPMLQAEGDWLSATNMVSYYGLDDPGCHPTLSIDTTWNTLGGELTLHTLVDTGCGTSLITSRALGLVTDRDGRMFSQHESTHPITLVSATGDKLVAHHSTAVTFKIGVTTFSHNVDVLEHLPHDFILGMDFLRDKKITLDFGSQLMSAPHLSMELKMQEDFRFRSPLFASMDVEIASGETKLVRLSHHPMLMVTSSSRHSARTGLDTSLWVERTLYH